VVELLVVVSIFVVIHLLRQRHSLALPSCLVVCMLSLPTCTAYSAPTFSNLQHLFKTKFGTNDEVSRAQRKAAKMPSQLTASSTPLSSVR
jgi:hypothetical protein